MNNIKQNLLLLNKQERKERKNVRKDYYYFKGSCKDEEAAKTDQDLLGQNWMTNDDVDYKPTQDIRNKVKSLLKKQARFMFSKAPTLNFKPYNSKDNDKCEELEQFISKIFKDNGFWNYTMKAFLMAIVKKRVLLRIEANMYEPINIIYNNIEDFNYEVDSRNKVKSIMLVEIDDDTVGEDLKDQIWRRHTYYIKNNKCIHKVESFIGVDSYDAEKPDKVEEALTGLDKLPGWIIINGGLLGDKYGESDLEDLKDAQNQYNKRISDFADALRFNMFPINTITDATADSVNKCQIAPNALWALVSEDENHQAQAKKIESNFNSAEPVMEYLKLAEHDMHQALDMPEDEQLKEIPSAKAMKYMYNDLIARCEEKWNDWEGPIEGLIRMIIEACSKFNCYSDFNKEWTKLKFNIVLEHNYPIPEDSDDKKRLAMEEVNSNVRSHRDYIREFSDNEDTKKIMLEIAEDIKTITMAEQDQFQVGIQNE